MKTKIIKKTFSIYNSELFIPFVFVPIHEEILLHLMINPDREVLPEYQNNPTNKFFFVSRLVNNSIKWM